MEKYITYINIYVNGDIRNIPVKFHINRTSSLGGKLPADSGNVVLRKTQRKKRTSFSYDKMKFFRLAFNLLFQPTLSAFRDLIA